MKALLVVAFLAIPAVAYSQCGPYAQYPCGPPPPPGGYPGVYREPGFEPWLINPRVLQPRDDYMRGFLEYGGRPQAPLPPPPSRFCRSPYGPVPCR